jgi:hypothetical protein
MSTLQEDRVSGSTIYPREKFKLEVTGLTADMRFEADGQSLGVVIVSDLWAQIFSSAAAVSPSCGRASKIARRNDGNAGTSRRAARRRCSPSGYPRRTPLTAGQPADVTAKVAAPPAPARSSEFTRGVNAPPRTIVTVMAIIAAPRAGRRPA